MSNDLELAPVAVFAYNRLDKIQRCLECLQKCELSADTEIYIFSDGYKSDKDRKNVEKVQNWLKQYSSEIKSAEYTGKTRFKNLQLILQEKNAGLANSIISGVSELIDRYGKVIVVEDDILVSEHFLEYMNSGLDYYQGNSKIWAIASYGYNLKALRNYHHDVYMGYRASSWGWATWKDRWETVDWKVSDYSELENNKKMQDKFCRGGGDLYPMLQRQMHGESDSWAIRWNYAASKQNKLTIYPKIGLVSNEGFDGSGSHTGNRGSEAKYFENYSSDWASNVRFENVELDPRITKEFYILHTDTFWKKVKRNLTPKNFFQMIKRKIKS